MKLLLALMMLLFTFKVFAQPTYTYVDPNPAIEKEKKDKEALFQKRKDDAFLRLQNCTKKCGSYAADANNPKDPCTLPGATPACICACNRKYDDSIRVVEQQEKTWQANIAKREEDYKNKKIKEQQQTNLNNNVQQQTTSQQQSNQNNPSTINDAIETTGNTILDIIEQGKSKRSATTSEFVASYSDNLYNLKTATSYYEAATKNYNSQSVTTFSVEELTTKRSISNDEEENNVSTSLDNFISYLKNNVEDGNLFTINFSGINRTLTCRSRLMSIFYSKNYITVLCMLIFNGSKPNGTADMNLFQSFTNETTFAISDLKDIKYIQPKTKFINSNEITENAHCEIQLKTGEVVGFFCTNGSMNSIINRLQSNLKELLNENKTGTIKIKPALESQAKLELHSKQDAIKWIVNRLNKYGQQNTTSSKVYSTYTSDGNYINVNSFVGDFQEHAEISFNDIKTAYLVNQDKDFITLKLSKNIAWKDTDNNLVLCRGGCDGVPVKLDWNAEPNLLSNMLEAFNTFLSY